MAQRKQTKQRSKHMFVSWSDLEESQHRIRRDLLVIFRSTTFRDAHFSHSISNLAFLLNQFLQQMCQIIFLKMSTISLIIVIFRPDVVANAVPATLQPQSKTCSTLSNWRF